jgi:transposase
MSMPRMADAAAHLRRLAVSRVGEGYSQTEVARFLGVSGRSVRRWVAAQRVAGICALATRARSGRPPKLTEQQELEVVSWLTQSPCAFGFPTERWTAPRLVECIDQHLGVPMNHRYLNDWLRRRGVTPQIPGKVARERDEAAIRWWVATVWPRIKRNARAAGAELVFTDESGLLMAPLVRTTQALVGQTPVLRTQARHRQKVSVAAALFRSTVTGRVRLAHEMFVDHYVDDFLYGEFLRERVLRGARQPLVLLQDGASLHHGLCTQK